MTSEQYNQMADGLRRHPAAIRIILLANRILTGLGFLAYPALILLISRDLSRNFSSWKDAGVLVLYIAGPGLAFILLSLYRARKNLPRPYQALDIRPIIHKDKEGHSFPSRHIFSLAMIAFLWIPFSWPAATGLIISSLLLSLIRVVGGVHYIRDVLAGFLIGSACGLAIDLLYRLI